MAQSSGDYDSAFSRGVGENAGVGLGKLHLSACGGRQSGKIASGSEQAPPPA
jgi:hypothetical protein